MFRLVTPVNPTGYGIVGLSLVKALHDLKVEFELELIGDLGTTEEFSFQHPFFGEALKYSIENRKVTKEDVHRFTFWHLPQAQAYTPKDTSWKNVIYSTFELDCLPGFSQAKENELYITTAPDRKDVFGLYMAPSHILHQTLPHAFWFARDNHLSYDKSFMTVDELREILSGIDLEKHWYKMLGINCQVFLSMCGKAEERKSTKETLELFLRLKAPDKRNNHLLIASCYNMFNPGAFPALLFYYGLMLEQTFPFGNLYSLKQGDVKKYVLSLVPFSNRTKLYSFLTKAEFFLSFSKGEGWNLPLEDMGSLGMQCIASDIPVHQKFDHYNTYFSGATGYKVSAYDGIFFNHTGNWNRLDFTEILDCTQSLVNSSGAYRIPLSPYSVRTWEDIALDISCLMSELDKV